MDTLPPVSPLGAERAPERAETPKPRTETESARSAHRVVVEQGASRWTYVIKSVDVRTGEAVTLWPSAQAVKDLLKAPGVAPPASVLNARI